MNTSSLLFCIILIGLNGTSFTLKYLADTLKNERPELWESLGKPHYGFFFSGKAPEAFKDYVKSSGYRNESNSKISRATLYFRLSGALLICGVIAAFGLLLHELIK